MQQRKKKIGNILMQLIRRAKGGAEKCVKISLSQGCTVYYIFNIQNSIIPTCKHLFCAIMAPLYLSCYVLSIFFRPPQSIKIGDEVIFRAML